MLCSKQRCHFRTNKQLTDHLRNNHKGEIQVTNKKKRKSSDAISNDSLDRSLVSGNGDSTFSYQSLVLNDMLKSSPPPTNMNFPAPNDSNSNNVAIQHSHSLPTERKCSFFSSLTALSCMGNASYSVNITNNDARLSFHLAKLLFYTSHDNRVRLAHIFDSLLKKIERDYNVCLSNAPQNNSMPIKFILPININDVRNKYIEGSNAYLSNLSIPPTITVGKFEYCRIHHCLNYLLQNEIPLQPIIPYSGDNITYLYQSKKAQEILKNAQNIHKGSIDIVLYIREWSDSFDPLSTKKNRGSVHLKTITFERPSDSKYPKHFYTLPVCLGYSKANRSSVEQMFLDDLNDFAKHPAPTFYSPAVGRNVRVHLELLLSMQDQLERRGVHDLMMGNSVFLPHWSLSLKYVQVYNKIRSCSDCRKDLLDNCTARRKCEQCCNWEVWSCDQRLWFKSPKDYPQNDINPKNENNLVKPMKINHKLLVQVVSTAHTKLVNDEWTDKQANAFLRVFGINNDLAKKSLIMRQMLIFGITSFITIYLTFISILLNHTTKIQNSLKCIQSIQFGSDPSMLRIT
jgi:hypothetical protein